MQYHNSWQKIRSLFNQTIATGVGYASRSALRIQRCQRKKISISIMLNLRSMLATAWQQLTTKYALHAGYVPRTARLPLWQWYRYNIFYNIFSRSTHTFLPTFLKDVFNSNWEKIDPAQDAENILGKIKENKNGLTFNPASMTFSYSSLRIQLRIT